MSPNIVDPAGLMQPLLPYLIESRSKDRLLGPISTSPLKLSFLVRLRMMVATVVSQ